MLDISQLITDLSLSGMHVIRLDAFEEQIDLGDLEPFKIGDKWFKTPDPKERLEWLSDSQRHAVIKLTNYLQGEVFSCVQGQVRFNDIWAGTALNVQDFHNDYDRFWPEFTASVNYYFDDSSPETGGLLQFSNDGISVIGEHYPKRGELIILNQSLGYLHRVTPCSALRRMISFKVAMPLILPNIQGV